MVTTRKGAKKRRASVAMIEHEIDKAPEPVAEKRTKQVMTAVDRRNWFRKQAGWPPLKAS